MPVKSCSNCPLMTTVFHLTRCLRFIHTWDSSAHSKCLLFWDWITSPMCVWHTLSNQLLNTLFTSSFQQLQTILLSQHGVQISASVFAFSPLECMYRSRISRWHSSSILTFFEKLPYCLPLLLCYFALSLPRYKGPFFFLSQYLLLYGVFPPSWMWSGISLWFSFAFP